MRKLLRNRLRHRLSSLEEASWERARPRISMVIAPHQDDEILGCGGSILKRTSGGTRVIVVFMTDGTGSHSAWMSPDGLREMRAREAIAAGQVLGVVERDIFFLGFPDGYLNQNKEGAIQEVSRLIADYDPGEVYIPFREEPPPDHHVTNHVVRTALSRLAWAGAVYEYPIWYWHHWPWVSVWHPSKRETLSLVKRSIQARLGLSFCRHFGHAVSIGDVIEEKRTALNQHKSQMFRLFSQDGWLTLHDVAQGEFLECFFQEYELFYHYNLP